jgi:hypothetical protein
MRANRIIVPLGLLMKLKRHRILSLKVFAHFRLVSITFFVMFISQSLQGQQNVTTVGFQFKPIFSSQMFGTGPVQEKNNNLQVTVDPRAGFSGGMIVRHGFTDRLSFETGISYAKRVYGLEIETPDYKSLSDFRIVGYEIPLQGLVYIQLAQKLFMNATGGASLDFFPSDIGTKGEKFRHLSLRNSRLQGGVLANLGWEWRTEKSGYFYLGASYHNPFKKIYTSRVQYFPVPTALEEVFFDLSGNYLTFDIRYFFHEDPEQRIKKEKKKKK